MLANIFSQSVVCLFVLFMVSFAIQKPVSLIMPICSIFAYISIALEDCFKKILVQFMAENALLMFSFRNFMVSCFIFKSLAILTLFLFMMWGCILTLLIYMQLSSFPNTTCWGDCLFSTAYSCLLCQRLIDCGCVIYLWALYSIPSVHMSVFVPISGCFD